MTVSAALLIDRLVGNPFDADLQLPAGAQESAAALPLAQTLEEWLDLGDIERAKLLTLGVGHARARNHPDDPRQVFDAATRRQLERFPRPASDYLRIVMAAGRCYRVLRGILGTSRELQRARRDTWAACFGRSLRHALDLEPVIRDHDVVILGETGTGKEAFARAIQEGTPGDSRGRPAPRAAINAAAIPETLVESELFGHIKGSFTGATETRSGRLRSAHGGCFFLDEVGDLPSTTQVKLLRVIETNEVYPLGADEPHVAELRYVAATHKDLQGMVERGEFRRDLYERLAGNVITIPPLRERPEDIVEIGRAFIRSYPGASEIQAEAIDRWLRSPEALAADWPGNVRELQNALRNLLLDLAPRPAQAAGRPAPAGSGLLPGAVAEARATLQQAGDWYIRRVFEAQGRNYSRTAHTLGIDRSTVKRRLG